jgi:hypothetical protein
MGGRAISNLEASAPTGVAVAREIPHQIKIAPNAFARGQYYPIMIRLKQEAKD